MASVLGALVIYIALAAIDFSNKLPFLKTMLKNVMTSVLGSGLFMLAVFLYLCIFIFITPFVNYAVHLAGLPLRIMFFLLIGGGFGLGLFTLMMELQQFAGLASIIGSQRVANGSIGIVALITGFLVSFAIVNSIDFPQLANSSLFFAAIIFTAAIVALFVAERSLVLSENPARKPTFLFLIVTPIIFCLPLLFYRNAVVSFFDIDRSIDTLLLATRCFLSGIKLTSFFIVSGIITGLISWRRRKT